jgi:hypothetical protein
MPPPDQRGPGASWHRYRRFGADGSACVLADWDSAVRYVKIAHSACSNFVFVGWDVAFTPDGAMILEGNESWDALTYQILTGKPLGHTIFAGILATQLDR